MPKTVNSAIAGHANTAACAGDRKTFGMNVSASFTATRYNIRTRYTPRDTRTFRVISSSGEHLLAERPRETTHQLDCTLQCNPSFSKFHENKKPRAPGSGLSRLDSCYLVRSSVPASVKCVIVSAQETLAVRFFILILASVCLPVAVIFVLNRSHAFPAGSLFAHESPSRRRSIHRDDPSLGAPGNLAHALFYVVGFAAAALRSSAES